MKNSRNPNSGCFSAVLRRLLCSGDPQTHPSGQISDLYQPDFVLEEKTEFSTACTSAAPGIVARLMGLDSVPERVSVPEDPARVSRSKSVNFIDYLLEFNLTEAKHRRFRTSVSFREVPSREFQEKQGQDLLFIYLENGAGGQTAPELLKHRNCEREKVLKKEEKNNSKISKLKDEPRRRKISTEKIQKRKEEMFRLGRREKKEILAGRAESHRTAADIATDDLRQQKSNSKKQWSQKLLNPDLFPSNEIDSAKIVKDETDNFMESLGNLSKLTEEEIKGENWTAEVKPADLEEMCVGLEGQILELMLDQVADELLGIW